MTPVNIGPVSPAVSAVKFSEIRASDPHIGRVALPSQQLTHCRQHHVDPELPLMGARELTLSPFCCKGKRNVPDIADDQNQLGVGKQGEKLRKRFGVLMGFC